MEKQLPDLPGSTPEDLKTNQYHGFFQKTPREVWAAAQIEQHEIKEKMKCEHFFTITEDGAICSQCFMGLVGIFEIEKGKIIRVG